MKTIGHIFFFFVIISNSFSQGLINNAINLYLTANSNIILSGNANWIQNGIVTCASGSNVKFTGNTYQYILGTNTTAFSNVVVNNSGGGVVAGLNFSILGTLTLTLGHFDLKQYTIDLGTTGSVSGENINSRIRATDASWNEGGGTGYIYATRNNPSGNVAGLGLNFTPSVPLGNSTIIIRGCNALQGSGSFTTNWSIFRWYRIIPGSGTVPPLTINNFYYWGGSTNPELNGHIESELRLFQQVNYGGPTYWEPREQNVNTTSDFVWGTTNAPIALNYIEVTLGSLSKPLPVELLNFKGICKNNKITLTWQTASEYNNYGFVIQKSNDLIEWEDIGFVKGAGNSSTITNYNFEDYYPYTTVTYYRLLQTDNNGTQKTYDPISIICNQDIIESVFAYNNNGKINVNIKNNASIDYTIIIYNSIGKLIEKSKVRCENQITYESKENYAAGVYYVTVFGSKNVCSMPVVIE
ncbi:MAG: hypothetical protein N2662_01830 [Bacteroidales bacterium]|nr:hypothetical protein [Bacteroidales bacterium]